MLGVDEIRVAMSSMKMGQGPGEDGISAELLKLGGESVVQWLSHLASLCGSMKRFQVFG